MKRFKLCANGCGIPPSPPSKVICYKCQDRITRAMVGLLVKWDRQAKERQDAGGEAVREGVENG